MKETGFDHSRECVRGSQSTDVWPSNRRRIRRSVACSGEPFFLKEAQWIPVPPDFSLNILQGKGYDTEDGATGKILWETITERLATLATADFNPGPATIAAVKSVRYGEPLLVRPRLGQGTFRVIVTDAYERRCTITGERTLPVLEAAHIKPYSAGGRHEPENGPLLVK